MAKHNCAICGAEIGLNMEAADKRCESGCCAGNYSKIMDSGNLWGDGAGCFFALQVPKERI